MSTGSASLCSEIAACYSYSSQAITASVTQAAGLRKTIHVFTSDILPFQGCAHSAGSVRSMQIIAALRNAGHNVTYSMPIGSYLGTIQREYFVPLLTAEEIWCSKH